MRVVTALLVCLGPILSGLFTLAQTSTRVPTTAASRAPQAIEPPRAPAFEYLGTLRAETGTRTKSSFTSIWNEMFAVMPGISFISGFLASMTTG